MKRLFAFAVLSATVGWAHAQAGFTIRRPLDGSVVRETFEVRIPRSSVPPSGFVGILINDKFTEAVAPIQGVNLDSRDLIYRLDTKGKKLKDGPLKIEAVLYATNSDNRQISLARSSVNVTVDNYSSIRIPSGGVQLRYNMTPMREYDYRVELSVKQSSLTDVQRQMNRETNLGEQTQRFRYRYTVMQSEPKPGGGKKGIVRLQPLPEKGKDYAILALEGESEPKRYFDYMMQPIYLRIDDTGREIWGGVPFFAGMEGTNMSDPDPTNLYGLFPMPLLPQRGVAPGGAPFGTGVNTGTLDLENLMKNNRLLTVVPTRGRLVGLEFERGVRCALIENTLSAGSDATGGVQELREQYWFAMDLGAVIKLQRTYTTTQRIREQATGGGGSGSGPSAAGNGGGAPNRPSSAGTSGGGTQGTANYTLPFLPEGSTDVNRAMKEGEIKIDPSGLFLQFGGGSRGQGGPGSRGGQFGGDGREGGDENGPGSRGGGRFGGGGGNSGGGGGRGTSRFVRTTVSYTMTME